MRLPLGGGHQHSWLPRPRHGLTGQPGKPRVLPSPLRVAPMHGHQLPRHNQHLHWANLRPWIWRATRQRSLLMQSWQHKRRLGQIGQIDRPSILPMHRTMPMHCHQQDLSKERARRLRQRKPGILRWWLCQRRCTRGTKRWSGRSGKGSTRAGKRSTTAGMHAMSTGTAPT